MQINPMSFHILKLKHYQLILWKAKIAIIYHYSYGITL